MTKRCRKARWIEYERRKKELKSRQLSPEKYETALRALAARLKV